MTPLRRMIKSRDSWKVKATLRATEMREQRKQLRKERERRKAAEAQVKAMETLTPPF